MFFGEFEYKIDEKGRIPIPPKFRRDLGKEEVVLTSFVENCITAYPLSEWKKLADTLTSGPVPQNKLRRLNRAIFAAAFSLIIDGQGRISLPATLRQKAGIEDEVIVAGANNYFELWNKEQWKSEKADSQEQAWQIIESLENR
ncbi:MAG: division/cell wall cluster transcriptional repressor MraZ [Dehalococcoidales bacterium]|jgi:MraZ protein|nr:division/cell wall cluster transcriptional repressor MraZ [Dehalococcoidales bacterium]|tara:strand:+ start:511 stop:939 length:429 start_codon:yes stop_codon:yes gene_type:complete